MMVSTIQYAVDTCTDPVRTGTVLRLNIAAIDVAVLVLMRNPVRLTSF
jgi:hypothetical protein